MARVTDEDRAHFARVAALKESERDERLREALARHPVEGILEGLELGCSARMDLEDELESDRRALGQAELAMRGRRLGRRTGT